MVFPSKTIGTVFFSVSMIYQLSPKTQKSNVFSKNVRFYYWCWNSSACWIWCENLFRHAFLGFLWRSEGGNGSTWDACRVFWHLFLVCLLRNLPSIASCNQPFLFGTVLVFLWGWCFSELVFFAMRGHTCRFGQAVSKRGRCSCWCRHHSIQNVLWGRRMSPRQFCRCLGEIAHGNWSH